jgi:hypothetical protein
MFQRPFASSCIQDPMQPKTQILTMAKTQHLGARTFSHVISSNTNTQVSVKPTSHPPLYYYQGKMAVLFLVAFNKMS